MVPSFAAYVLAMWAGRWREWWWALGACVAPATGITLISGQTGYLSGALMVAGLRLLPARPVLAGVMFGLLTYKPQLGVLIPVALVAMGGWRAIAAAAATFAALRCRGGLGLWLHLWGLWAHSLIEYATRFTPVVGYMPTIYANAILLGAWRSVAWGAATGGLDPRRRRRLAGVAAGAEPAGGGAAGRGHVSRHAARLQLRHADDDDGPGVVFRRAPAGRGRRSMSANGSRCCSPSPCRSSC